MLAANHQKGSDAGAFFLWIDHASLAQQDIHQSGQRVPPLNDLRYRLQDSKNFVLRCIENNHMNPFKASFRQVVGPTAMRATATT